MLERLKKLIIVDILTPDIEQIDHDIKVQVSMSTSYILMLVSSCVVATLGLLLGSSPIVIGGMIISPLMWPLLKLSLGITLERESYIRQSIRILGISIAIALVTSILITYLSPLKIINEEILLRTNPTLIDMVVALVAGTVAGLGMVQPRISQGVAGVAIATSLMPPICVSGIGIALGAQNLASGGIVLFLANVLAIVFACVLTFLICGVKPKRSEDNTIIERSLVILTVFMVLTSIPLFLLLSSFVNQNFVQQSATTILTRDLNAISQSITIQEIKTEQSVEFENTILVDVRIQLPPGDTIDFEQKQLLISNLESTLGQQVELNLSLTPTISVVTEDDEQQQIIEGLLQQTLAQQLEEIDESVKIQNISSVIDGDNWTIDATVNTDPAVNFTLDTLTELEARLSSLVSGDVILDLILVPRIQLTSTPQGDTISVTTVRQFIEQEIEGINENVNINDVSLLRITNTTTINYVRVQAIIPSNANFSTNQINELTTLLQDEFEEGFVLEFDIILKNTIRSSPRVTQAIQSPSEAESEQSVDQSQ